MTDQSFPKLKLPRQVETDPRCHAIEALLARDLRPLWSKGTLAVPHMPFLAPFETALLAAQHSRQLERGLEHIDKLLSGEEHGLLALREKQGTPTANRISRVLVISDDGAERFYRSCEAILIRHADRVLGLRVTVPSAQFGQKLFGADSLVKVVLVSEKAAVTHVLLALSGS